MATSPPQLSELARRIIELEAGKSPDPAASAAAVETAFWRLKVQLVDLLGAGGISAILRRALHLTRRDHPSLEGLAVSDDPAASFASLAETLTASSDEQAIDAVATLLRHLLDLLVMLLGEDLGLKPIRKLWPQATSVPEIDE